MAQALVARRRDGAVDLDVGAVPFAELGEGEVLVEVAWSGVNYKDALVSRPDGNVARREVLVPGIDLAGRVVASETADFAPGDRVLAHCYGIGVSHHGGFATHARLPGEWLVPLPRSLDERASMVLGTAGYTAATSVERLEAHGIRPGGRPIVVTGATGGVGSFSVALLAARGFEVIASTGKPEASPWLKSLGAAEVIGRRDLAGTSKPLESQRFAAAIDCVGGETLAGVLSRIERDGAVAASGLTGGAALHTTVFPFILRAVALYGVDVSEGPIAERRERWDRLGAALPPPMLESFVAGVVALDGVPEIFERVLSGSVRGRYLVRAGAAGANR